MHLLKDTRLREQLIIIYRLEVYQLDALSIFVSVKRSCFRNAVPLRSIHDIEIVLLCPAFISLHVPVLFTMSMFKARDFSCDNQSSEPLEIAQKEGKSQK